MLKNTLKSYLFFIKSLNVVHHAERKNENDIVAVAAAIRCGGRVVGMLITWVKATHNKKGYVQLTCINNTVCMLKLFFNLDCALRRYYQLCNS